MTNGLKGWEAIVRQKLSQVPSSLAERLRINHDTLTDRDILLIRLLTAEISTRQIALYLDVRLDSVKKAKHRLRKKLKLASDTSWQDFLTQNDLKS